MKNNSEITIFDLIKSMSTQQLSNFFDSNINGCPTEITKQQCRENGNNCSECWEKWLNRSDFF